MLKGNTNWNHYKTFIAVYESGNLRKSSDVLRITRAAVSRNIKTLSNQLGLPLFVSHSKGVVPTSIAIEIYPVIKDVTELLTGVESRVAECSMEGKTIIRMAVSSTSVGTFLKDYLKEFCTKYPEIGTETLTLEHMDLSKQKQQDFVIATKHMVHPSFKVINLYASKSAFFATKEFLVKHGLTSTISKDQFIKLPIIVRNEGRWRELCKKARIKKDSCKVRLVPSAESVYDMTKGSMGLGFLTEITVKLQGETDDAKLVKLNVDEITCPIVQVICGYNEKLTKPARTFVEGFQKFCKDRLSSAEAGHKKTKR